MPTQPLQLSITHLVSREAPQSGLGHRMVEGKREEPERGAREADDSEGKARFRGNHEQEVIQPSQKPPRVVWGGGRAARLLRNTCTLWVAQGGLGIQRMREQPQPHRAEKGPVPSQML